MSATASSAPPAVPPPRRRHPWWLRAFAWLVFIFMVLVVVAAAGVYWLLNTPGGAQFVFNHVTPRLGQGVRIEGIEGAIGGPLRIRLVEIDRPDLYVRVGDVDMDTAL